MGNMARDRCIARSLILAILVFDLVVSFILADLSHYRYDSHLSEDFGELEQDLEFQLGSHPGSLHALERRRRAPIEPVHDDPQSSSAAKPSETVISTKSSSPSANVTYSTQDQNVTDTSTTAVTPKAQQQPNKPTTVSTPIVPNNANDTAKQNATVAPVTPLPPSKVHVWANQTLWKETTTTSALGGAVTEDDAGFEDAYPTMSDKILHDNNITMAKNDTYQYYNSTFTVDETVGRKYWIDLDNHPNIQVNPLLSRSHRRAATIKLSFDFPFYGHKVRNITIATGGFLYTGEYVHSWLAATQYIAPLMANFDTTLSNVSKVKYADNGTAFTVEWENVHLQDKKEAGPFTFQVTLLQNGDIIFVYAKIPVLVEKIEDKEHPVKIGLSDAYMMDRTHYFTRRKTIYEYHRVNFNRQEIKNWTSIYLTALPTCLQMENCSDCLTKIKEWECKWCPKLSKCSTGMFRFRQEWLQKGCDLHYVKDSDKCPAPVIGYEEPMDRAQDHHTDDRPEIKKYIPNQQAIGPNNSPLEHPQGNMNMSVSGIIGILFVVSLIVGLGAWAGYAYRNPHSTSGQMLIRYRPSQWSWRRGEARYTAATIHM
ncbi:plexin domain-containing protein 2 [Phymastichus coffea]|uniref:plexin domain-containing protein 2 n=1 Tax=Phymastichus coffea TaxID=108790 RepID=UPI00273ABF5B|nr:plexin domain-containing protein 2 [Phymastichus coffea]XP_058801449.1 plexin domain-containing protein 2 [Phymastichus coffea]